VTYKKKKNKNLGQKLARKGRKMQRREGASGFVLKDYYIGGKIA
jgi:hypothetical protein